MGNKVYIEDFNPTSKCWNRTAIFDLEDFDVNRNFSSRYGGVVRIRYVDEVGKATSLKEVTTKAPTEETVKRPLVKEKDLTEEIANDRVEVVEVVKEEPIGQNNEIG